MSYALEAAITQALAADATIVSLLGTDSAGAPSISPYQVRDSVDSMFPRITVSRFGSVSSVGRFQDSDFAQIMDGAKIAVCVWDKNNIDKCYRVNDRVRAILLSTAPIVGTHYLSFYRFMQGTTRDDLFDTAVNAYHLHTEYNVWTIANAATPQPNVS